MQPSEIFNYLVRKPGEARMEESISSHSLQKGALTSLFKGTLKATESVKGIIIVKARIP